MLEKVGQKKWLNREYILKNQHGGKVKNPHANMTQNNFSRKKNRQ